MEGIKTVYMWLKLIMKDPEHEAYWCRFHEVENKDISERATI